MSTAPRKTILLIEDNAGDARLFRETLNEQSGHQNDLVHFGRMADAENYLAENAVDIILLDIGLPDVQGLDAVHRARMAAPRTTLVVLSGMDDESLAARALQEGAQDYLVKGQMETRSLVRSLRFAVERKNMEDALFAEKERAQITLNSIADAVMCADIFGNITFFNLVAEFVTGWSPKEARGKPTGEVFQIIDAVRRETVPDPLERAVRRNKSPSISSNSILVRRDKSEVPIEESVAAIHDGNGDLTGGVIVFRDVSAARAMAHEAAHLAAHDCLTGLPNRAPLHGRICRFCCPSGRPAAIGIDADQMESCLSTIVRHAARRPFRSFGCTDRRNSGQPLDIIEVLAERAGSGCLSACRNAQSREDLSVFCREQ